MVASASHDLLDRAIALHKMGDLAGAIRKYEDVLEQAPQHPGALNLLGLAHFQKGSWTQAVPLLERALALRPDLPGANFNLGTVLLAMKRHEEAAHYFEKALAANPNDFEACAGLAAALTASGRAEAAVGYVEKAISLRPNFTPGHISLANMLLAAGDPKKAAACFRLALSRDPQSLEAHFGLARAYRALNLPDEVVKVGEQAVAIAPQSAEARSLYGGALHDAGRFTEAVEQHQKALALNPETASSHFDLASSLYALNRYDLACSHYQQAIALKLPADLQLKSELMIAWTHQVRRRYQNADKIFDRIIREHGNDPPALEAKKSKGMMHLNLGHFAEGWPLYEYRRGADLAQFRERSGLRWKGEPVNGKILVWGEQGLGDQILHASMVDDLRGFASSIILEVEPRLVPLFARSFPEIRVVPLDSDLSGEKIQAQTSIANLGTFLRPGWDAFPQRGRGYLVADAVRAGALRARLAPRGEKIVGLSWRSVSAKFGHNKSSKLIDFDQVLRLTGIRFVDLQYGDTAEERAAVQRAGGIAVERLDEIDNTRDIDGLASLISACDAVITVSNTTAHLAGALGRPTWVFVPFGFAQIWYWFIEKKQSPWYPRVNVRHQVEHQSWEQLISASAAEIGAYLVQAGGDQQ